MCPNTEFFLVRIFPHSDWIRRDTFVFGHILRCDSNSFGKNFQSNIINSFAYYVLGFKSLSEKGIIFNSIFY